MTATTGRLRIGSLGKLRQALVRRWFERALTEMYEAEGVDKGFTAEETRIIHLTVDDIADQFKEAAAPELALECPNKGDLSEWTCLQPRGTCIRCVGDLVVYK